MRRIQSSCLWKTKQWSNVLRFMLGQEANKFRVSLSTSDVKERLVQEARIKRTQLVKKTRLSQWMSSRCPLFAPKPEMGGSLVSMISLSVVLRIGDLSVYMVSFGAVLSLRSYPFSFRWKTSKCFKQRQGYER